MDKPHPGKCGILEFAQSVLSIRPYPWQRKALCSIAAGYPTALVAANGSGKTSTILVPAALWALFNWPLGRVIVTSASWSQLRKQFFDTIRLQRFSPSSGTGPLTRPRSAPQAAASSSASVSTKPGAWGDGRRKEWTIPAARRTRQEATALLIAHVQKGPAPKDIDKLRLAQKKFKVLHWTQFQRWLGRHSARLIDPITIESDR